jgi:hypothetical protein
MEQSRMVEITFLAYVLIVTHLAGVTLIMLYIHVVYFITCVGVFNTQWEVTLELCYTLWCTLRHKERGGKLFGF